MVRLASLIIVCLWAIACSSEKATIAPKEVSSGPFVVGECVHMGTGVYKVTVVGSDAYAFMRQNGESSESNFYTYPKVDIHKQAVKVDCFDDLKKKHMEYLKSIK